MRDSQKPGIYKDNTFMREEDVQLPAHLDDASVANHLKMISRTAPQQLPGVVMAVREKWVYGLGRWVEESRLKYLNAVLLQLEVSHGILTQCLEMDSKLTAHRQQKEQRACEAQEGLPRLQAQAKAEQTRAEIERAKAEQAKARRERQEFEHPAPPPPPPLSAEEKRKEKLKQAEDKVERLRKQKEERLARILRARTFEQLSPDEQNEYRQDENGYANRIRDAKEDCRQYE